MQRERRVQVVLGEAERADGLLRFVLEAEGFDLIGMASNEEELSRVLRGAKPSVLVLDGGISAAAALDARQRIGGAALVVVWPDGVSAVLAEERVEPHMVIEDLGDAVRRAAARVERADTIVVPEAEAPRPGPEATVIRDASDVETEPRPPLPQPWRRRGRAAQVLVAAATWLLVITAFTAIAAAVPHVVDTFRGKQNAPRPSSVPRSERPAGSTVTTVTTPSGPEASAQPDRCEDEVRGQGVDRAGDEGDHVRAQGCPKDRGTTPRGSGDGGNTKDAGSQGEGNGPPGGSPEPGSQGDDAAPPDDQGSQGEGKNDQGTQGEDNDDQGKQGEGNGGPGGPPEQTGDQAPQVEDPSDGQNASTEPVGETGLSDQPG
ncbi:MAG TPA: hypothetical protein VF108_11700 [Actinomycetota bacterium]